MIDWGTVFSKNPEKRKYLLEILPIENYNIKVLSCMILKESQRHGETDLLAEVQIDACSPVGVENFISSFEEKSFTTLNKNLADRFFENGKKIVLSGTRICHHHVQSKGTSPPKQENKDTNCPSQYSFKLKPCKKAGTCKCLCFKINNRHNHVVDGGDSLKWQKVSKETKDLLLLFLSKSCRCQKPKLSMRKS